jgi:formimidoylglutamate deiminase
VHAVIVTRDPRGLSLPGIASVHSHAFQRALRGRTQRRTQRAGTFWSWRGLMFALADRLDPTSIYDLSHYAFVELLLSGVTAVGEFHYVHHEPSGAPYAERTALADAVVRAAGDAGIRITLLRVLYERAGYGRTLEAGQRRFVDADPEDALRDLEALARHEGETVKVGLAPHSVRAVTRRGWERMAAHAASRGLVLHAHVSEQRRELHEAMAEYGMTPVRLLAELGVIGPRFTAIHATHLAPGEAALLGAASSFVAVCRSTERDLGDGLPDLGAMVRAGVRLTVGADSHTSSDPFEEARAMELDERARVEARHAALEAPELLRALTSEGYASLGWGEPGDLGDRVVLSDRDPALAGADDDVLDDLVAFHARAGSVRDVWVAGRRVVEDGVHPDGDASRLRYERTLRMLLRP